MKVNIPSLNSLYFIRSGSKAQNADSNHQLLIRGLKNDSGVEKVQDGGLLPLSVPGILGKEEMIVLISLVSIGVLFGSGKLV